MNAHDVKGNMMKESSAAVKESSRARELILDFHGVRYQIKDVSRAVAFYTDHLGFKLEHQQLPAFATISFGPLHILLSGPEASSSRPMPDGHRQEPGGSNRVVLRVSDLEKVIDAFKEAGLRFRQANPIVRPRRQSDRVIRARSIIRTPSVVGSGQVLLRKPVAQRTTASTWKAK